MNKKRGIYNVIMLVTLSIIITFVLTTLLMYNYFQDKNNYLILPSEDTAKLTELDRTLIGLKNIIDKKYLGEINEEELYEGAIKGYISALNDKYSSYYTKEEMDDVNVALLGNYVGVGAYLQADLDNNVIKVLSPIEDSPAKEAGLLSGDIIYKVDGVEYNGEEINKASNAMKGKEGTTVDVEVIRDGEIKKFTITRRSIKVYHISSEVIENNIGYMYIQTFDEGCAEEFKQKYEEISKKNIKSLIIDLRDNGGGIVDETLEILDCMLDKNKTTLITVDKDGKEQISKTEKNKIIDIPIVVLVNEQTASASEIMAGALKDHKRATIVGTKTYGKGVIQELMYLTSGAALKLTTNEYYTPNRNKINEIGIKPDYEIELTKEEDTQLKKAIELLK